MSDIYFCSKDNRFNEITIYSLIDHMYKENHPFLKKNFDVIAIENAYFEFGNSWTEIRINFMRHVKECLDCKLVYKDSKKRHRYIVEALLQEITLNQFKELI